MNWDTLFADRIKDMKRSTIREILKLTAQPDVISFAGGLPAPELFPKDRIAQATARIMQEHGEAALQYSTTEGVPELRQFIADRISTPDFKVGMENIIIISGSQQGLDLICRVTLNEGDTMLIENPSYLGMLMASKPYHVNYVPVPTDSDGAIVDQLPPLLAQNPKMLYMVPNFQNPQGVTLSKERREQLIDMTYDRSMIMVEDNPYGELRYSGEYPPHLLQLDAARRGVSGVEGNVVYIGTFSKVLTPGLRIGWMIGHERIIDKLVQAKQSADLHTSTLTQYLSYEVAKDGFLDEHIERLKVVYRERRDTMLDALSEYFPEEVKWHQPEGGLFLMIYLPEGMDSTALLQKALTHKVAFVPGTDFHVGGIGANTFRLNFSNAGTDRIVEGVRRLGTLLKSELMPV